MPGKDAVFVEPVINYGLLATAYKADDLSSMGGQRADYDMLCEQLKAAKIVHPPRSWSASNFKCML